MSRLKTVILSARDIFFIPKSYVIQSQLALLNSNFHAFPR